MPYVEVAYLMTAACCYLLVMLVFLNRRMRQERQLAQQALAQMRIERQAERKGRIKAEIALRHNPPIHRDSDAESITLQPIGYIRSCFKQRNGTPRQSLLVAEARAVLELCAKVPEDALQGLDGFSHCWILFYFHQNTNLHGKHQKAKVQIPRLNGEKRGVYSTRSPHRINPIGLSLGRILQVQSRMLHLGGLDVLDGSPVLDIKPYLPSHDAITRTQTQVPDWVASSTPDEDHLQLKSVHFSDGIIEDIKTRWTARGDSLFACFEEFESFLRAVLKRDIRSVHQRLTPTLRPISYRVLCEHQELVYQVDAEHELTVIGLGGR